MPQRNLLLLLLATAVSYACYVRGEQNPYSRYVADGLSSIEQEALDPAPSHELFNGAMRGMVDVLRRHGDEHSKFVSEAEAGPLRSEIHQLFGGIGVRIGFEGKPPRLVIVVSPDAGTPAAKANLRPGDSILMIDGQSTAGMSVDDALLLIRGEPGTVVRLSIQRPHESQPRTVELVRDVIPIESVLGDRRTDDGRWQFSLSDDPRIAHIRVVSFGERTAAELADVMGKVAGQGVEAVVLDLRDNDGGALDAAVAVCQMLLPAGKTIVETRGRGQTIRQRYATTSDGPYRDLPIAVVVNQHSASAAEIVAACLQDHHRAIVVGERTFGKGTVQQLVPLESGKSLLKLTWASFWRPSGSNIHHAVGASESATWGVLPDAGFERKLSPDEYAAYQKYRSHRDGFRQTEGAVETDGDAAAAAREFVDEPLQLAVAYLQAKLGDKP